MATYWENSCSFGLRYVSWYKYLIVSLVFSHLRFWSGNLFLIAPFPDLCLLVPFSKIKNLLLRNCQVDESCTLYVHVPDSSLYIICVFYSSRIRTLVAMVTLVSIDL